MWTGEGIDTAGHQVAELPCMLSHGFGNKGHCQLSSLLAVLLTWMWHGEGGLRSPSRWLAVPSDTDVTSFCTLSYTVEVRAWHSSIVDWGGETFIFPGQKWAGSGLCTWENKKNLWMTSWLPTGFSFLTLTICGSFIHGESEALQDLAACSEHVFGKRWELAKGSSKFWRNRSWWVQSCPVLPSDVTSDCGSVCYSTFLAFSLSTQFRSKFLIKPPPFLR